MSAYNTIDAAVAGVLGDASGYRKVIGNRSAIEDIAFGVPVFCTVGDDNRCNVLHDDVAKIVFSADLITDNVINMKVNGVSMAEVTYATSHANTMNLIVTALQAMDGVEAVKASATEDSNGRTIYIRVVNTDIAITEDAVTAGNSQATITDTYLSSQIFLGVAMFIAKYSASTNTSKFYQYENVSILNRGEIWVLTNAAVKSEDEAYIIETGADKGKFGNSGMSVGAKFKSTTTGAGLALVEINGSARMYTEQAYA